MTTSFPPDIGPGSTRAASLGRIVKSVPGRENTTVRVDTEGGTGHKATITASNGTDEATYEARIRAEGLDVTVSAVADASSAVGVRDPLLAAIQAEPLVMAFLATAKALSTNAIVLEAIDGKTLVVTFPTNPSTHLSVAYTAAATAPQYLFGRAVEVVAATAPAGMLVEGIRNPVAIDGAIFDLTQTYDAAADSYIEFLVRNTATGATTNEYVTWAHVTGAAETDAAAVTALEALPFIASVDIESAGVLTVTAMPGYNVSIVDASAVGGSGATAITLATAADDLPRFALVMDDGSTPMFDGIPNTTYPAGPLIGSGILTADPSGSTTFSVEAPGTSITGTAVFVETDDSAGNAGRLYDTPSPTRTPWAEPKWEGLDADDTTKAHIRL